MSQIIVGKEVKLRLIENALACGALKFGDFTLKSGKKSKFYFDARMLITSRHLKELILCLSHIIPAKPNTVLIGEGVGVHALLGGLQHAHAMEVSTMLIRGMKKGYGDANLFEGYGRTVIESGLAGNIFLIEDVITTGNSLIESIDLLEKCFGLICGKHYKPIVIFDRREDDFSIYNVDPKPAPPHPYYAHIISLLTLGNIESFIKDK